MKILLEHLKNNKDLLLKMSQDISIAKHTVNLGTAREGLVSNFLEQNLPEYIKYHTGEIFDSRNERSGQIDIVLHPISSPKINLYGAINLFPIETVLTAIEVKSNLNSEKHLKDALNSCKNVKKLKNTSSSVDQFNGVPFIVFAYNGYVLNTLEEKLKKFTDKDNYKFHELPELIIVLNRGYYLIKNTVKTLQAGATISKVYTSETNKYKVLLGIFTLLIDQIEKWSNNPRKAMPIKEYIVEEDTHYINDLF